MKRATVSDVAKDAGVSVATVDRVLNGRLPVREETAKKVYASAEKLGFHGLKIIRQRMLADMPSYRFGVILRKERQSFYQAFTAELQLAAAAVKDRQLYLSITYANSGEPSELSDLLIGMAGKVSAVAVTGPDHHDVTAAVSAIRAKGVPTFALLTDLAQGVREAYLGLNNMKVGRSAAWMIAGLSKKPGKVALFIGGHRFHGHSLRETGFRAYMREFAPEFQVLDAHINLETRRLTYELLMDTLSHHGDLVGVYCMGGGMEGAIQALRESGRASEITCLVNELTPESRQALQDHDIAGVFQTPLPELCRDLINTMVHTVENGMAESPGQRFFPASLWVPESV
ncbi:LacI family DNA-binding transcriptional regulator [Rhizobium sp. CC-YZS058]|uniref:LacI family DNA-binding transcriptional regulator n=1 Tax=Rhizobium sp. CC-YZS058 TaxID=3042153 RepID=UPI002B062273|nr:LacI family DNA-binding transcriptional regulator [Rhizobium sp. CC-YZS058]MEA3537040.1 LacI family DNA-binding transcriptional regulator [Rhizobium sp. CC-YZS058]